ncbi:hypothetical protein BCR34DRAFT_577895 [Clohesyomyces aquaticus]|uniref:RING-type domain-containing protein n=1 Tax=Clohesyomyces aquaticus TaxID=1231657 RepID=A0A1Y1YHR6_9PLEO|nr:hypothetical protein BCR34DRAFT_577895 [Clohesyomyces aquaticus]
MPASAIVLCRFRMPKNANYRCPRHVELRFHRPIRNWYCSLHDPLSNRRCQVWRDYQGPQCTELAILVDEGSGKAFCGKHNPETFVAFHHLAPLDLDQEETVQATSQEDHVDHYPEPVGTTAQERIAERADSGISSDLDVKDEPEPQPSEPENANHQEQDSVEDAMHEERSQSIEAPPAPESEPTTHSAVIVQNEVAVDSADANTDQERQPVEQRMPVAEEVQPDAGADIEPTTEHEHQPEGAAPASDVIHVESKALPGEIENEHTLHSQVEPEIQRELEVAEVLAPSTPILAAQAAQADSVAQHEVSEEVVSLPENMEVAATVDEMNNVQEQETISIPSMPKEEQLHSIPEAQSPEVIPHPQQVAPPLAGPAPLLESPEFDEHTAPAMPEAPAPVDSGPAVEELHLKEELVEEKPLKEEPVEEEPLKEELVEEEPLKEEPVEEEPLKEELVEEEPLKEQLVEEQLVEEQLVEEELVEEQPIKEEPRVEQPTPSNIPIQKPADIELSPSPALVSIPEESPVPEARISITAAPEKSTTVFPPTPATGKWLSQASSMDETTPEMVTKLNLKNIFNSPPSPPQTPRSPTMLHRRAHTQFGDLGFSKDTPDSSTLTPGSPEAKFRFHRSRTSLGSLSGFDITNGIEAEEEKDRIAAMYFACNICLGKHNATFLQKVDTCGHQYSTQCFQSALRSGTVRRYNCSSCREWMSNAVEQEKMKARTGK